MPKVLIAYGTRYGSTGEVAEQIGILLKNEKVDIEVVNLREVKQKSWPSVDKYIGVIVGSGIRAGKWVKEPREFLEKNKDKFGERYLGVFLSCATAVTDEAKAKKDYIETPLEKLSIKPDASAAFGPVFDFSDKSRLGFFSRRMLMSIARSLAEEKKVELKLHGRNDFRDWAKIRNFAKRFAGLVKSS